MNRLSLKEIKIIQRNKIKGCYEIIFNDNRITEMHKRRTIPALLTLIKYGEGCESDLTNTTNNLKKLKNELHGRIPNNLILDSYSDANKPFSELWNEEGFVFIKNPVGEKRLGSQKYILDFKDHGKLFTTTKKAKRKQPDKVTQAEILKNQKGLCNFCGSKIKPTKDIPNNIFAKDRVRLVWDHRVPIEKGGDSKSKNYQGLCFYCNKCKWQICNICDLTANSCALCALGNIEKSNVISPTKESIKDRVNRRS